MGVTISGMTGAGSIRHNNRSFSAANVDRSRTEQNIVFCNEDLKQVYHMVFDEALAAYNAKKTKTRDKIPDYYEHIRQSKQEKLFHEAIFQIGNMSDCGCGTPDGERAAAALKDFAESFAERNPHLRVFNMVLHMDEARLPGRRAGIAPQSAAPCAVGKSALRRMQGRFISCWAGRRAGRWWWI